MKNLFLQHEFQVEFKIAIEILLTSTVKKGSLFRTVLEFEEESAFES
jgi:hypothetical protein